ncbi:lipid-A-disaccharide synthase-related protein [Cyanobium sp. Morenito 9A2]|uniref:lipid-A-disaccharide synthase-related protein n=1 Tax=Cyanobium sp. Morenito 9A2 TaxID=2823718 RepID=UPI0020CE2293|nr:lipid-A-disaccharide synthase-related protein [Cyanobium sp. Morenito 9A2]MCP9851081.1 lipid-A-disaccharide synthase-related protein [Cyanobium sp. Morenito 9A2]
MSRILLLSNGHGEDLSGALIGQELTARGFELAALPLVGHGQAYKQAGLPVLGRTREYSTGGLGYTSHLGRLTEIVQGQLLYLLRRLALLARVAGRYDLVVVVGDVIPVLAGWLMGRPVVTYLVAYSSHYEGRLRLPWPCGPCLASRRFRRVFSRDALTADDLSQQLGRPVSFLGNPFLDRVLEPSRPLERPGAPRTAQRLGLLPGSRLPEAERNLALMLQVLDRLPAPLQHSETLALEAALVGELSLERIQALAEPLGWELQGQRLRRGPLHLQLRWGQFAAIVQQSDLLLSMTGTAAEQAVGLGKPVLQLPGFGPQFTPGFAEAQRRLLGPSLFCAEGAPGSQTNLRASAQLIPRLLAEPDLAERCGRNGQVRIGSGGGAARMADQISALLGLPAQALPPHG